MVLEGLLGPIAVIVQDLLPLLQVVLGYEYQPGLAVDGYRPGEEVAVARVVDQPAQLAGFQGGVNAAGKTNVKKMQTSRK